MIAHQRWWRGAPGPDVHGLVVALWTLAQPAAPLRLAALSAVEALAVARDLPAVGDHTLLAGVTALAFFDPSLLGGRWHVAPAIAATLIAEVGLAVLLAIPRTRVAGVVLGLAFHAALALAGNVPFATYALALYVAFLPPAALPRWRPGWRAPAALVAGSWVASAAMDEAAGRDLLQLVLRVAVAAGLIAFAVAVLRRPRDRQPAAGRGPRSSLHPVYAAAALILALNAASPYVGLKTEASFAMFSNLQTGPGTGTTCSCRRPFGCSALRTSSSGSHQPRRRRWSAVVARGS